MGEGSSTFHAPTFSETDYPFTLFDVDFCSRFCLNKSTCDEKETLRTTFLDEIRMWSFYQFIYCITFSISSNRDERCHFFCVLPSALLKEGILKYLLFREISSVPCDHLEGWDREGGREMQEGGDMGIYVCIQLIHFVIQQKLTQHCKAIICQ